MKLHSSSLTKETTSFVSPLLPDTVDDMFWAPVLDTGVRIVANVELHTH